MSDNTGIEWTDATWNPVTGCTKVSPGCDNCYAETFSERFRGTPGHYFEGGFDIQLRPDKLDQPLRWKKPRRIFVNSMSDLFHKDVPDEYVAKVFAVMALAHDHTFQVLTKRHGRMHALLSSPSFPDRVAEQCDALMPEGYSFAWPLPNVWLGVSTEDQKWADIRIPALLSTPAKVRFVSAEPLLGPIDLWNAGGINAIEPDWVGGPTAGTGCPHPLLDWVIVGGESGRNARPMHPEWATSLRDQCSEAQVPFLFKQWGEWAPGILDFGSRTGTVGIGFRSEPYVDGQYGGELASMTRVGKKAAGRELDGRTWDEFPKGES